jgi:hypothetical protein
VLELGVVAGAEGLGETEAVCVAVGLGVGVEVMPGVAVVDALAEAVDVMVAVDVLEGVPVEDAVAEGEPAWPNDGLANTVPAGNASTPTMIAPTRADRRNLRLIHSPSAQ